MPSADQLSAKLREKVVVSAKLVAALSAASHSPNEMT
jgi:hypothetical protein